VSLITTLDVMEVAPTGELIVSVNFGTEVSEICRYPYRSGKLIIKGLHPYATRRKVEYQLVDKVKSIFPEENSVPAEFQLKAPIQTEYLINGELRHWAGPTQESFSSIYLRTSAGLAPKLIGSLLNEKAPEAWMRRVLPHDHGRGPWPTMSARGELTSKTSATG